MVFYSMYTCNGYHVACSVPLFYAIGSGTSAAPCVDMGGRPFVQELQATVDISYIDPVGMGSIATIPRALSKHSSDSRAPRCSPQPAQPVIVTMKLGPPTRTPQPRAENSPANSTQADPTAAMSQEPLGRGENHDAKAGRRDPHPLPDRPLSRAFIRACRSASLSSSSFFCLTRCSRRCSRMRTFSSVVASRIFLFSCTSTSSAWAARGGEGGGEGGGTNRLCLDAHLEHGAPDGARDDDGCEEARDCVSLPAGPGGHAFGGEGGGGGFSEECRGGLVWLEDGGGLFGCWFGGFDEGGVFGRWWW